jgi:5-methylcytosine-specific restriction protein A
MPKRPQTFRPRHRPAPVDAERQRDAERRAALATRKLYNTARWRNLRDIELAEERLCVMCLEEGVTTLATVRDHVEPHRGDVDKFWNGERQSLCKTHHDRDKQRLEARAARG